jgi:phosphoribosyl 1,2-cyclic phosphodiesterase
MGVVPSLLDMERSLDVHVVEEVFISHPHLDHFGQLYWLASCTQRSRRPEQPRPLPVYSTPECWRFGPERALPEAMKKVEHRPLSPGQSVALGDLRITPFAVDHGPGAPGAVGFVAQHGGRKIICTCDFLSIPQPDDPVFAGADVCFIESNTWHPAPQTNHQSIVDGLALVARWKPKRTYLIHYSGYEDYACEGQPIDRPLTQDELRAAVAKAAGPHAVEPARHGMILGQTDPWP